ncbi:hypothetical protein BT96DRAFT_936476 [Gymnopus androsaceus JB14]|uniref:Uncharacterized protein n=1 Tax=Gymnopus androsaceus JB14 TaxID=1447944 RepID=A0A6A4HZY8_9AGAR|nr:hypothetical protein BT96DRAFT_936476 [Gymnopus androsaceus JB14]
MHKPDSQIAASTRAPLISNPSITPIFLSTTISTTITLAFSMSGYLDYWCSLEITGSAERNTLTAQLETEFENVNSMVETLIEVREERRREIACELAPIEAHILSSYHDEATTQGVVVTPQLLEKMRATAHQKALLVRDAREQERAAARCRKYAAERYRRMVNGQKTIHRSWKNQEEVYVADERRYVELVQRVQMFLLERELAASRTNHLSLKRKTRYIPMPPIVAQLAGHPKVHTSVMDYQPLDILPSSPESDGTFRCQSISQPSEDKISLSSNYSLSVMDYQPLDILPSSPESESGSTTVSSKDSNGDSSMNESNSESGTEDGPKTSHDSLPYGGVPNRARIKWLEGRDNDGWENRHGNERDWHMSTNPSWGSLLDTHPVHPLVNLRSDFGAIGLSWVGAPDRDTSLDDLCHEDWADIQLFTIIQVHRTTELGRILEHGEPTFTGTQILERYKQVDEEGEQRSEDLREMDEEMEALYRQLRLLVRTRAFAARQVGSLCDAKAKLRDLKKIAFTCL